MPFVEDAGRLIISGYVDLGLPSGTLCATCNIGAGKPEESGDYFSWGETEYTWGIRGVSLRTMPYAMFFDLS